MAIDNRSAWRLVDLTEQPCAGVGPPAFGGGFGDAEDFGGFWNFHGDGVTELHQFSLLRFEHGEAVKGFVVTCGFIPSAASAWSSFSSSGFT